MTALYSAYVGLNRSERWTQDYMASTGTSVYMGSTTPATTARLPVALALTATQQRVLSGGHLNNVIQLSGPMGGHSCASNTTAPACDAGLAGSAVQWLSPTLPPAARCTTFHMHAATQQMPNRASESKYNNMGSQRNKRMLS